MSPLLALLQSKLDTVINQIRSWFEPGTQVAILIAGTRHDRHILHGQLSPEEARRVLVELAADLVAETPGSEGTYFVVHFRGGEGHVVEGFCGRGALEAALLAYEARRTNWSECYLLQPLEPSEEQIQGAMDRARATAGGAR